MFGSDILDIAVGLVLVYLLLSLIMTAVQESVSTILKSRSGNLTRAMTELLQGDQELVKEFYDHPLIYALHRGQRLPALAASDGDAAAAAARAADAAAAPPASATHPSYIPRETFAAVMIDLAEKKRLNDPLQQAYDRLDALAGPDVRRLRRELEGWYDGAMDRAAGWYKRHTQIWLFVMGLVVSVLLNVNSVTLAQHLAVNPQAREYANRLAEQMARQPAVPDAAQANRFTAQLDEVRLPVGWNQASLNRIASIFPADPGADGNRWLYYLALVGAVLSLLGGYLITALAIMLGSPFWFDLLNRVMVIRSTVKPREKSPDEPSQDGGRSSPSPSS
ncbi:MAG TPA: hypothetical protein VMS43_01705 [Allosphingosinicella sp.]|nr:hypothetical protein [Allosphingosinicella sp.]